jgi:anti-anti-sigma factor
MTSYPHLTITTEHHGRRSVLLLQGELDLCTGDRLRRAISSALKHRPQILVVDLSELDFIDCSGLSVLIWARRSLAEQERQFLMTGARPIVRRLIHLAGADAYLPLSPPDVLPLGRAGQPDSYQANCATSSSSAGSEDGKRASMPARPEPKPVSVADAAPVQQAVAERVLAGEVRVDGSCSPWSTAPPAAPP